MARKARKEATKQVDLVQRKRELEESVPELKQSYNEFLASFARFRETHKQFEAKGNSSDGKDRTRTRMRA